MAARERSAHLALRETVEAYGDDVTRELYAWFDLLNRSFFSGALGAPLILISPPSSPRALGDFTARDVHGLQSRIRIAPSTFKLGMHAAITTLLHEMVHAWAQEIEGTGEAGYKGHGPIFTARCNAIGALCGFATVFARGRGGLDSSGWPYQVVKAAKAAKVTEARDEASDEEPRDEASDEEPRDEASDEEREELAALRVEVGVLRRQLATEQELWRIVNVQLVTAHQLIQTERCETRVVRAEWAARRLRVSERVEQVRAELSELAAKGINSGGGPNRLRSILRELEALQT